MIYIVCNEAPAKRQTSDEEYRADRDPGVCAAAAVTDITDQADEADTVDITDRDEGGSPVCGTEPRCRTVIASNGAAV